MSSRRSAGDSRNYSRRNHPTPSVTASFEELSLGETSSRSQTAYPSSIYGSSSFTNPFDLDDPSLLTTMSTYDYMPSQTAGYPVSSHGFDYPSLESPFSRGMSGAPSQLLPSSMLASSVFAQEFREAGRDIARQRRHRNAQVRRDRKTRTRKAATLVGEDKDPRLSQADDLSGSVDTLTAHSTHAYGHGSYGHGSGRGSFPSVSQSYDPYQHATYTTATSSYPTYATTHGQVMYSGDDRQHRHSGTEAIIVESSTRKYECFDHGCNGRTFSTQSNLMRHQREKDGKTEKHYCTHCGSAFTRKTARDGHVREGKCRSRR